MIMGYFMRIYLIQHGEAKREEEDPERGLTEKGKEDIKKSGKFLNKLNVKVNNIWHSGKKRAEESALILKECLSFEGEIEKIDGINPMDEPEGIYEKLKNLDCDLIIVGHLPNLSKLASLLLTQDKNKDIISFKMASVLCLEKKEEIFEVNFFITPEII